VQYLKPVWAYVRCEVKRFLNSVEQANKFVFVLGGWNRTQLVFGESESLSTTKTYDSHHLLPPSPLFLPELHVSSPRLARIPYHDGAHARLSDSRLFPDLPGRASDGRGGPLQTNSIPRSKGISNDRDGIPSIIFIPHIRMASHQAPLSQQLSHFKDNHKQSVS
jgi:hypothetical protein